MHLKKIENFGFFKISTMAIRHFLKQLAQSNGALEMVTASPFNESFIVESPMLNIANDTPCILFIDTLVFILKLIPFPILLVE